MSAHYLLCPVCFLPGTTITLQSMLTTYYAVCVSCHALPLHSSLCSILTLTCVLLPRHYHYTAICAHYLLCTVCFLPGTTIILHSLLPTYYAVCVSCQALPLDCILCSLLTMHSVFQPRHYHYTPVCAHYLLCTVCFLPGTTITLQSVLTTYYALCVSSQALPLHANLCSLLTMPCVLPPRHYHYTSDCAHYLLFPVCFLPGTTITLHSVLTTCPVCFLPGTTITLLSVLTTCPVCFLPGTNITLHSVLTTYCALCVSSQALPLHCILCSLLTVPCLFPPRHYHYTAFCAHYLPSVFPPRHYHYTAVYAHYLLCLVCFLPGTTITLHSVLTTCPVCFLPGTTITLHSVLPTCPVCFFLGTVLYNLSV
jgi:hypothetical protein